MDLIQGVVIAIVQGATELFPVSSLGHAVVLPALLHWHTDQRSPEFLPFLVMLHLGTATALLGYFWEDWKAITIGLLGFGGSDHAKESRRLFLLVVIATLPAVLVGFFLEKFVRGLFGSPLVAAGFLVVNGFLLIFGEQLRGRGTATRDLASLTRLDAFIIGCFQCAALVPGISRSGATIVGGLLRGVGHEGSAHFSFLIATPIILGATVLEVPKLLHEHAPEGILTISVVAAVVAGITAWLSAAFLMRYFRRHDAWALNPFAYYCIFVGALALAVMFLA